MVKPTRVDEIDDVKRPGQAAPLPTSRPIVVTNRPMLANDPMMVSPAHEEADEKPAPVVTRTARVIEPLGGNLAPEQTAAEADSGPRSEVSAGAPKTVSDSSSVSVRAETAPETPANKPETPAQSFTSQTISDQTQPDLERDPEAALTAEEIAAAETQAKRDLELEAMIASGKYHVPINAVQRRRSRTHVLLLGTVGVLLALVLADAVMDAGFIKLPSSIPHTHFFSTTP